MKIELSYQVKGKLPEGNGGVPDGGTVGQTLAKVSNVNYDMDWVDPVPGPEGPPGPQGEPGLSSSYFLYRVDTTATGASDPGTARYRYNNATQSLATELYFDWLTLDDFNPVALFMAANEGDEFVIQDKDLAINNQVWRMTGPVINMPDWFIVQAEYVSGTVSFTNLTAVAVLLKTAGPAGPPGPGVPPGGTLNNVLVKASGADYDAVWSAPQPDLATFEYTFDVGTTEPASSANIRFNSSTMTAVTKVWVNHTTANGLDITNVFTLIEAGMRIFVQDKDQSDKWASFNCTGPTINKGNYDEFPVVFRDHGNPLTAHRVLLNISGSGTGGITGGGLPAGGAAKQVLAKVTATDYDAGWVTPASSDFFGMALVTVPILSDFTLVQPAGVTGSTLTALASGKGLSLRAGLTSGLKTIVARKAITPTTGNFTVTALYMHTRANSGNWGSGIFIEDNAGKLIQYGNRNTVNWHITLTSIADGNPVVTPYAGDATLTARPVWYRIIKSGTSLFLEYSLNGETWWRDNTLGATTFLAGTISAVGFSVSPNTDVRSIDCLSFTYA